MSFKKLYLYWYYVFAKWVITANSQKLLSVTAIVTHCGTKIYLFLAERLSNTLLDISGYTVLQ